MNKPRFAIMSSQNQGVCILLAITLCSALSALNSQAQLANTRIAFQSNRDGNWEIYLMNVNGTNQTNLTNNLASDYGTVWSADGTKIGFSSTRDGNMEIYVMNADGADPARLTNNPANDYQPTWSPDGAKIAFVSDRDGNAEIYVMNADGTDPIDLTNNGWTDYSPAWSPDATKIVFVSDRHDWNDELYAMNADGTNLTRLTTNPDYEYHPAWSPDGAKIAFQCNHDGNCEIYVMNADGTKPTDLTNSPAEDRDPSWSPDGTKIVFHSNRDGNREIYAMNADGTNPTRLTNNPAEEWVPAWSPFLLMPVQRDTLQAVADAYVRTDLDARRNDNYGAQQVIGVGTSRGGGGIPFGGPDAFRTLIQFDLTGVAHADLTSAVLEMTVFESVFPSTYEVDIHRIVASGSLTPWIEGNGFEGFPLPPGCANTDDAFGVAWVGAGDGGDANNQTQPNYDPNVLASATVNGPTTSPGMVIGWDVTPLVRAWLDGTVPNHGMLLRDGTSDGTFRALLFGARDGKLRNIPDPRNQDGPRLILTYPVKTFAHGSGPVTVFVGVTNSDNNGRRISLLTEVYKNETLISKDSLVNQQVAGNALNNSKKFVIPLNVDDTDFLPTDVLSAKVYVKRVGGSGNFGVRMWYNRDSVNSASRGWSRLYKKTVGGTTGSYYYFLNDGTLATSPGSVGIASMVTATTAYQSFGTWQIQGSLLKQQISVTPALPATFALYQNYPNPFNPVTHFPLSIANCQLTILKVYDLLGREVVTLVNEVKQPGIYTVAWDAGGLASGVYLYRLQAGSYVETRKLVLTR